MARDGATLRVAAVQMAVNDQIVDNLSRIREAMHECAEDGVELAVFPETALTGYSPSIGHGRRQEEWAAIRQALEEIAALAAELDIGVVVGSEAWDDDAWVNRIYVFSAEGQTVSTYDKVHLIGDDIKYYRAGTAYPVFTMKDSKLGLQICYDARFPEGYRALLRQGVQVILQGFYGAGSDTWKVPVLEAHLRSRAAESGCFVVAANVAGPLQIVVSQIIDPLGLILAEANQDREEIITADLDLGRIDESEIRRDYFARYGDVASNS